MKICSINRTPVCSSSATKMYQFSGNMFNKMKRSMLALALTGGLFMAQPIQASNNMDNFNPSAETNIPVNKYSINFLKGAAIFLFAMFGIAKISDFLSNNDKNTKAS